MARFTAAVLDAWLPVKGVDSDVAPSPPPIPLSPSSSPRSLPNSLPSLRRAPDTSWYRLMATMTISSEWPTSGGNHVLTSSCISAFCTVAPTPPPMLRRSLRYDNAPEPSECHDANTCGRYRVASNMAFMTPSSMA